MRRAGALPDFRHACGKVFLDASMASGTLVCRASGQALTLNRGQEAA
jgi:hypothetical protein